MLVAVMVSVVAFAQTPSSMGKYFLLTFLNNGDHDDADISLIVSGPRSCSGVVSNPNNGWSKSFTVPANGLVEVTIPQSQALNMTSDAIQNKGLFMTTTDTVSLYLSNFVAKTFDATNVLPVNALLDDYMIQTYPESIGGNGYRQQFVVVAVEDNTVIDITPKAGIYDDSSYWSSIVHQAGVTYTKTLNSGQCYYAAGSDDLSGTRITARDCAKILVLAGHEGAQIPLGSGFVDHVEEQAMPTAYWGKNFIVTGSNSRNRDKYCITALEDNCKVYIGNTYNTTLNAGESQMYDLVSSALSSAVYVKTTQPACCYTYITGAEYYPTTGGEFYEYGDPSVILNNPVEQRMNDVVFSSFATENVSHHYVNIVVETAHKRETFLDGVNIGSQFYSVPGQSKYSYARVEVPHGSHRLQNNKCGFVAHVYGLGYHESYGYAVGTKANILNHTIVVNGVPMEEAFDGFHVCDTAVVDFEGNANYEFKNMTWDFGDGTTHVGPTAHHTYAGEGTYNITLVIEKTDSPCIDDAVDTLKAVLRIGHTVYNEISAATCLDYYE